MYHYQYEYESLDLVLMSLASLVGYKIDDWDYEAIRHGLREYSSGGTIEYTFQGESYSIDFEVSLKPNRESFDLRIKTQPPTSDVMEDIDRGLRMLAAMISKWSVSTARLSASTSSACTTWLSYGEIHFTTIALAKIINLDIEIRDVDDMFFEAQSRIHAGQSVVLWLEGDHKLQVKLTEDEDRYFWTEVVTPPNAIRRSVELAMSLQEIAAWKPRKA